MYRRTLLSALVCVLAAGAVNAQVNRRAATVVTRAVDDNNRVTLIGNTHPAVKNARDLGPVADSMPLEHLFLQLRRPAAAQRALDQYLEDLHNPASPNFHKWGTAAEFGERFGLAPGDLATIREWLQSKGFTVHRVYPNLVVDFSGNAAAVREAFHTSIHALEVNGAVHIANVKDPEIPAALASAVVGPVKLNNFQPVPLVRTRPQYTVNQYYQLLVPLDLHTIYNLNPLFGAGISGKGQTVVLLERTNLYSDGDWYAFRKTLGLARKYPFGSFTTIHPQGSGGACSDPGVNGDDIEATLDVEWATASAPNAAIVLASCADTDTGFGPYTALQNLLTGSAAPPPIMSLSYGAPESEIGTDYNAFVNQLYQLAEFEGVSLFVATGDAGAAGADVFKSTATHGINVNGFASTPHNVAVGGTDFADTYFGVNGDYWSGANGPSYNSARSYVPEIPWNDSCASRLLSTYVGYANPYGADGFCNSALGEQYYLSTAAGSGGASACASGDSTIAGVVNGTCKGYAKPGFQQGVFGNPNDGVRDLPDVSLMAGAGVWGHYFVICYTDPRGGGTPCNTPPAYWAGAGGTSASAPIMAGIQALVNQVNGPQGNPNYAYYALARSEYGASGRSACNASLGSGVDPSCVFHDVTLGDIDVNCKPLTSHGVTIGTFSCFYPSTNPGANGVLSTSNTTYQPAYPARPGWDFATGIGTVNAYNLVTNWPARAQSVKRK